MRTFIQKVLLLTAGSVLFTPTLSAVSAFAAEVSSQKNLNKQILKNEQELSKARLERQKIAQALEEERRNLEEITANNLALQKNQHLNQQQLTKLQQNLLQKKAEQRQTEAKYQKALEEESKLELAQILWNASHPKRSDFEAFLYEITPPHIKNQNENLPPLFFSLLGQENTEKQENLTTRNEKLEKENLALKSKRENLQAQQKAWLQKETQIEKKLEESQKLTAEHQKNIAEHDAEIKKRQAVKAQLEKKLADLIAEEDLRQRIERQKILQQRQLQIQRGQKPSLPTPAKAQTIEAGTGLSPLPSPPTSKWGQIEDGIANNAIKYPGHANENVISPVNAIVLFAGNFEGFGQVIILDCGPQRRMVLSGLGKISVKQGDHLQKKQVIGQMPSNASSTLSLQLRIKNIPINPAKYLKN
ncbi:hypothetical protein FAI40_02250 [Acetobacteraceae bacterium]|nr:hypothetical protein FAI40_02250 [Acetobacteraceae bacterium]